MYVNGKALVEPYAAHNPMAAYDPFMDDFPPTTPEAVSGQMRPEWSSQILKYVRNGELIVPPGKYFAMGDNRDDSLDSRYWGFVDRDAIVGQPVIIYWSVQSTEDEYDNPSFWSLAEGYTGHDHPLAVADARQPDVSSRSLTRAFPAGGLGQKVRRRMAKR